ncbi:hypothetical protein [Chryseobacterium hagamense]|uniref:Uncharacterized protein n=1 Tax=Chryseobacterium hagamense TaxID=395935 RepID=A0A511YHS9_9FLAO|nr:hypothetical protein [Chryseobacterium hagamense]GEN74764.1 hypothetical protein CHA01nite_05040 [Chryseobacterium hagamense]
MEEISAFQDFETKGNFIRNRLITLWNYRRSSLQVAGNDYHLLIIFKGIVAYGLWFEHKWAVQAAIIDAIIGIGVCIIMMVVIPFTIPNVSFTIRLELIPLYFYLVKMQKIKSTWENH